jgi:aminoglycoside phosphotransferase (APT) family kinase protein
MTKANRTDHPIDDANALVDIDALGRWLLGTVDGFTLPFEVSLMSGGRSNLTLLLREAAGRQLVLRRPPIGEIAASAHDVLRECRIVDALAQHTDLPLARPIAWCDNADVIGAPFWLMEFVEGIALADRAAAETLSLEAKTRFADQLSTLLAALHSYTPDVLGLDELQRPGAYVERQLRRWSRQLAARTKLSSDLFAPVQRLLESFQPIQRESVVLHGDFKPGNVLVDKAGNVRAIVDWELAAVGDPLADLGWLLASWSSPLEATWIVPPATSAGGFPDARILVDNYARKSDRDPSLIAYYVAFADWRWSCINEGILDRLRTGALNGANVSRSRVERQIAWQLERAHRLLNSPDGIKWPRVIE